MAQLPEFENVLASFKSPDEIIAELQAARDKRLSKLDAIPDQKLRMQASIGEAIGMLFEGRDFAKNADVRKARLIEDARTKAREDQTAAGAEYEDTFAERIDLLQRTADEMRASGLDAEADLIQQDADGLRAQKLSLMKLEADYDYTRARTENTKESKDELLRLQKVRDSLDLTKPADARRFDEVNARIRKITEIVGRTEFDVPFDEVQTRSIEKSMFENTDALDGFQRAADQFDPTFLTASGRIKNWAVNAAEIAGLPIADEDKARLRDYTQFTQTTTSNLNAYIKAITGAQMAVAEAERLLKDVPTPEDGPTKYKAKLDSVLTRLEAVRLRSLDTLNATDRKTAREIRTAPLVGYEAKVQAQRAEKAAADAAANRASLLDDILGPEQ